MELFVALLVLAISFSPLSVLVVHHRTGDDVTFVSSQAPVAWMISGFLSFVFSMPLPPYLLVIILVRLFQLYIAKLNDHFDVVGLSLQSLLEILRFFTARDQAAQPLRVGLFQILTGPVPVALVGIDAAEDHVVLQNRRRRHVGHDLAGRAARCRRR